MERQEILQIIQGLMEDVFVVSDLHITDTTVAADVEQWDSLNNIQLVVAIEKRFKIKFTAREIQGFKNVGDICQSIENKLQQ